MEQLGSALGHSGRRQQHVHARTACRHVGEWRVMQREEQLQGVPALVHDEVRITHKRASEQLQQPDALLTRAWPT